MSLLFSLFGFAAQFCVIASFGAIVISSVCPSSTDSVLISEDHPSGAELSVSINDSHATLFCASSYCAKSMVSASCTTTINEPVVFTYDYSSLTVRELKALCKSQGFRGYSSLRKHELIALLSEF